MIPGATPLTRIPIAASRGARERMRPFMPVVKVSLMGVDAVGREITGVKSIRTYRASKQCTAGSGNLESDPRYLKCERFASGCWG